MLDAALTSQLRTYLELIAAPIELAASLDDSPVSAQTRALLTEIAALSDRIRFVEEPHPRTPSFAIRRVGTDVVVRFAGVPLGHEFSSLVLALIQVGGHPPKLDPELVETIRDLPAHDFVTYMSLTCVNCPTVVQALNTIAVLNPRITHTAVEGGAFPDEVRERGILAVPTVFADGQEWASGRMEIDDIVARLDAASTAHAAARLTAKEPFDVLVIGGGPAGSAAAVYAARKGIRTGVVVERFGGQVLDTNAIENLIGTLETEGPELGAALERHVRHYGVDIMKPLTATALHPAGADGLIAVDLDGGGRLRSRTVVLAPGARWRTLGVPGEEKYRTKGVTFCPHCDGPLFAGRRVAVVGGGNSGVEAAIDLAGVVGHVTVLELLAELRADAVLLRKLHSLPNVNVLTRVATTEVIGDGNRVTALRYQTVPDGELHTLEVAGVFVQIGLVPNTSWLTGSGVDLASREIVVDARAATNLPGVFAAGDATTVPYKQIVIALGQGATAALSAFDHLIRTSAPDEADR